jgi:hypothetical protein
MITRSLSHRRHWHLPLAGECGSPVVGLKRKGIFLRRDGARCPDLGKGTGPMNEGGQSPDREKVERASQASTYWSSTTNANNSNNA